MDPRVKPRSSPRMTNRVRPALPACARPPQKLYRPPQEAAALDRTFAGKCRGVGAGGEVPTHRETKKRIEEGLGLAAKQRFVMCPADADIETVHAACATFIDHVAEQNEPRALARVLSECIRVEHVRA